MFYNICFIITRKQRSVKRMTVTAVDFFEKIIIDEQRTYELRTHSAIYEKNETNK